MKVIAVRLRGDNMMKKMKKMGKNANYGRLSESQTDAPKLMSVSRDLMPARRKRVKKGISVKKGK